MMRSVIAALIAAMFAPICYAENYLGVGVISMGLLFVPYGMLAACFLAFLLSKGVPLCIRRFVLILSCALALAIVYAASGRSFSAVKFFVPMFMVATLAGIAMYRRLKSSNEAIEKNRAK